MIEPDLFVFHDETGSTHPNSAFGHGVAVVRADRMQELISELAIVRREAGVRDELRFKWNRCGTGQRGRSCVKYAERLLDWFEQRGHLLFGFECGIIDRSSGNWKDSWVSHGRDYAIYNRTAASVVAHAVSYLAPHRASDIVNVRMFSDYRRRDQLDDFYAEVPALVSEKCQRVAVQFTETVQPIGLWSPENDAEVRFAKDVLQVVDFFAGASFACWSKGAPANEAKARFVARISEWHHAVRPMHPQGEFASLKRSFEILQTPDVNGRRTRYFPLPHLAVLRAK